MVVIPSGRAWPLHTVALFAVHLFLAPTVETKSTDLPNIVFVLVDDWGWADASWHREPGYREVQTPNMQSLVDSGIELDRNYVHKYCSPTRCAIQSGRNPIHVNAQNVAMTRFDPENPRTGISGIPLNMTGFAQRLGEAGYKHRIFAGKADIGMAYYRQTPMGRGYTDALFYFNHDNDYWSFGKDPDDGGCHVRNSSSMARDLFGTNPDGTSGPQYHLVTGEHCWGTSTGGAGGRVFPANMTECAYEDDLFTNFTVKHILQHDADDGPLLAFHAAHSIHAPLEVVPDAYERFSFVDFDVRRRYHAMVWNLDRAVGRIIDALKTKGMYDDTLIVVSSDNGGPIYKGGGANNFPHRGGKAGNWEGGIRVNGLVGGGMVPQAMRGRKLEGLITAWDWYATFVEGIAGLDPTDTEAASEGLPPLDSVNQWPYLTGATDVPPRMEVPFGTTIDRSDTWATQSNKLEVGVLIQSDPQKTKLWKLMLGKESFDQWTGPETPNATLGDDGLHAEDCGFEPGCLFDLMADPGEHVNVADEFPEVVLRMRRAIGEHNTTVFAPNRPNALETACAAVLSKYKDPNHDFGWWGPFADELVHTGADPARKISRVASVV